MGLKELPSESILESLFRRQCEKDDGLKEMLALYNQDVTQRGEPRSYSKLKTMVETHLEQKRRAKNRDDMRPTSRRASPATGDRGRKPKQGECRTWVKTGSCPRGEDCPWDHPKDIPRGKSPKPGVTPRREQSQKKGGKGGRERSGSPDSHQSNKSDADQPVCRFFLKGTCKNGDNCKYRHPPYCKFDAKGKCNKGNKCKFLHEKRASQPANSAGGDSEQASNQGDKDTNPKRKTEGGGVARLVVTALMTSMLGSVTPNLPQAEGAAIMSEILSYTV